MTLELDLSNLDATELRLLSNYFAVRGAACEAAGDLAATIEFNSAILSVSEFQLKTPSL